MMPDMTPALFNNNNMLDIRIHTSAFYQRPANYVNTIVQSHQLISWPDSSN